MVSSRRYFGGDGQLRYENSAATLRILDDELPTDGAHPIGQTNQSVTARISTADTVGADLDPEDPVLPIRLDLGAVGMCVLHDIGKRSGHDEVGAGFDLRRKPLTRDVDLNGKIQPGHDRADAIVQSALGEDGGKDPVSKLAKLGVASLGVRERLDDQRFRLFPCLAQALVAPASGSRSFGAGAAARLRGDVVNGAEHRSIRSDVVRPAAGYAEVGHLRDACRG